MHQDEQAHFGDPKMGLWTCQVLKNTLALRLRSSYIAPFLAMARGGGD